MITAFAGGCDCSSSKLSSSRRSVHGDRSPYQKWFTALLRVGAPLAHGLANIIHRFSVYRGCHTSQEIERGTNQSPTPLLFTASAFWRGSPAAAGYASGAIGGRSAS